MHDKEFKKKLGDQIKKHSAKGRKAFRAKFESDEAYVAHMKKISDIGAEARRKGLQKYYNRGK